MRRPLPREILHHRPSNIVPDGFKFVGNLLGCSLMVNEFLNSQVVANLKLCKASGRLVARYDRIYETPERSTWV